MTSNLSEPSCLLNRKYASFSCSERPDVHIHFTFTSEATFQLPGDENLLIRVGFSSFYRSEEALIMVSGSIAEPNMIVFFRNNFCDVDVFFYDFPNHVDLDEIICNFHEYPPLRMTLNFLLGLRGALLVHGCGINDDGEGYLFAGHSNSGKSTLARLWNQKSEILGDEFCVLAPDRYGGFRIYGTPWPGDYGNTSYGGALTRKIFFLRHSPMNTATPVYGVNAIAMLLSHSFVTLWEPTVLNSTLDGLAALLSQMNFFDLGFFPDENIVDFIRCI